MSHIVCDKELCVGCLACVTACMDQHYEPFDTDAVSPRKYILHISEKTGMTSYKTSSCLHCQDPECMKACKQDAIYRDERGYIRVRPENCIGCKACQQHCPYHMIVVNKNKKAVKCDGCSVRIGAGLKPACLRVCPTGALSIKD